MNQLLPLQTLTPSRHVWRQVQRRMQAEEEAAIIAADQALWHARCLEQLPSQAVLETCLRAALQQPYPIPDDAAFKQRSATLHPDPNAAVSPSELYLQDLQYSDWTITQPASACFEVLMAHSLPYFSNPEAVDFRLLTGYTMIDVVAASAELSPPPLPSLLALHVKRWLSALKRDPTFAQRRDGVIVRRGLMLRLQTLFRRTQDEIETEDDEEDTIIGNKRKRTRIPRTQAEVAIAQELKQLGVDIQLLWCNEWDGHQLLLLCELPPARGASSYAQNLDNDSEAEQEDEEHDHHHQPPHPFAAASSSYLPSSHMKFSIVDNVPSQFYFWPVHGWIKQAFQQAQQELWPLQQHSSSSSSSSRAAVQCETVHNRLYTNCRLGTTCMATSFRAALIASLLQKPAVHLQRPETALEGTQFATLIKLQLCRMRRFLLTDERIWSRDAPHAVFSTGNGVAGHSLDQPCLWLAALRGVPPNMHAANVAHWVFRTVGATAAQPLLPSTSPIYFVPNLTRALGFTHRFRPASTASDQTCITTARFRALSAC